jgi:hypothetical protein
VIAAAATLNVLPPATAIGWPLQFPYQTRIGAASVSSSDTMDQAEPPFVQVNGDVPAGRVTEDPDELVEEAVVEEIPPAVYPEPDSSVPEDDPVDAVEVSFSFIAPVFSAVS